ncbi:hypothetical protein ACWNXI_01920 [Caldibacillus thermoamylovorans]
MVIVTFLVGVAAVHGAVRRFYSPAAPAPIVKGGIDEFDDWQQSLVKGQ